jgi:hypothetical protein
VSGTTPTRPAAILGSLVVTVVAVLAASQAASASAGPTIELTRGTAEPVESISTQLGAVVTNAGGSDLFMHVKPTGGAGCGANPEADSGEDVFGFEGVTKETNPVTLSRNWTFRSAGSYRICAWIANSPSEAEAFAETTLQVRKPHLALNVSTPATVAENQTFQVVTTAQAETQRSVFEYVLPNTGGGCPANSAAASDASGARTVLYGWDVTGGPFNESKNESISSPGSYVFCAYFDYEGMESPPELAATAITDVVAPPPPCIVPSFAFGAPLGDVEGSLRAAHCSVGPLNYSASTSVHKGGVIALNPGSGTHLNSSASVDVDVSAGMPCVVPSVRSGGNVRHVEHLLVASYCGYVVAHAHSHRVRHGAVIRLGSRSHSRLFPGTRVQIVVSSGSGQHH